MGKLNWKKVLLFSAYSAFAPSLGQWAESVATGAPIPFTVGTILLPAIPGLIGTLAALFSNPRHSR